MKYPCPGLPAAYARIGRDHVLLIIGFAAVLGLMVVQTLLSLRQMDAQLAQLTGIVNGNMAKVEVVARMHAAARERTLTVQRMLMERDPFARDALWERFNQQATLFIRERENLFKLPLSPDEHALLVRQGELSRRVQPMQIEVVELLARGERLQAEQMLIEQAIPVQDQVLAILEALNTLQRQTARAALDESIRVQRRAKLVILTVAASMLLLGIVVAVVVVRRTQLANRERERLATHDVLTGLPNRLLMNDRIEQALGRARHSGRLAALLFIDLDRFKIVNDTLGHKAGDELLLQVACRLRQCIRSGDTVARLGGDEFVVMIEDAQTAADATVVAEKILQSLGAVMHIGGHEVYAGASIGIALYPEHGRDVQELLRRADTAMYHAKERGRNSYQIYTPEMDHSGEGRLALEADLRQALPRGEILVHYQPQVDVVSGRVIRLEALARWRHPQRGLMSPGEFLAIAEEAGLMLEIGPEIMRQACQQLRQWLDAGLPPTTVTVNLTSMEFWHPGLIQRVEDLLREYRLDPQLIEIELTEGMLMRNIDHASHVLNRLKGLGVRIAMDDFGTGYSSLARLKSFPLDVVKIDRSFVRDIHHDASDAAIARAIIAMAETLGFAVVAEGVESIEQMEFLARLGCNVMQGYLISPPAPAEDLEAMLGQGWRLPARTEPLKDGMQAPAPPDLRACAA